jgi:hypothetical protein
MGRMCGRKGKGKLNGEGKKGGEGRIVRQVDG